MPDHVKASCQDVQSPAVPSAPPRQEKAVAAVATEANGQALQGSRSEPPAAKRSVHSANQSFYAYGPPGTPHSDFVRIVSSKLPYHVRPDKPSRTLNDWLAATTSVPEVLNLIGTYGAEFDGTNTASAGEVAPRSAAPQALRGPPVARGSQPSGAQHAGAKLPESPADRSLVVLRYAGKAMVTERALQLLGMNFGGRETVYRDLLRQLDRIHTSQEAKIDELSHEKETLKAALVKLQREGYHAGRMASKESSMSSLALGLPSVSFQPSQTEGLGEVLAERASSDAIPATTGDEKILAISHGLSEVDVLLEDDEEKCEP
ncbi:DEGP2 [Symbiodinium sp. CCMP2592]|nr:DEGP2 [Symbiodinium sp. CCMP2592]